MNLTDYYNEIANQDVTILPSDHEFIARYLTTDILKDPIAAAAYKGAMEQIGSTLLVLRHDIHRGKIKPQDINLGMVMSELLGETTVASRTASFSDVARSLPPRFMFHYMHKKVAQHLPELLGISDVAEKERSGRSLDTIMPDEIMDSADVVARITGLPLPSQLDPTKMIAHDSTPALR